MPQANSLPSVDRLPAMAWRLFGRAAVRVGMAFCVGLAILVATHAMFAWQLSLVSVVIISVLSAGVSVAALLPGYFISQSIAKRLDSLAARANDVSEGQVESQAARTVGAGAIENRAAENDVREALGKLSQVAMVGGVAAMAIRSLGTVALFAVCRYQFAKAEGQVAFLVISWYALLTLTEVISLARGAMVLDTCVAGSHDCRPSGELKHNGGQSAHLVTRRRLASQRTGSQTNFFVEWLS